MPGFASYGAKNSTSRPARVSVGLVYAAFQNRSKNLDA